MAGLHDSANALLIWTDSLVPVQPGTAWIVDGVDHLGRLLSGLTDLLHHPQAQDRLWRSSQRQRSPKRVAAAPWTEGLLHDLLLLADAHGCFRDALLSRK